MSYNSRFDPSIEGLPICTNEWLDFTGTAMLVLLQVLRAPLTHISMLLASSWISFCIERSVAGHTQAESIQSRSEEMKRERNAAM